MTGGMLFGGLEVPIGLPPGWHLPLAVMPCGVAAPSAELSSEYTEATFCFFFFVFLAHDPLSI